MEHLHRYALACHLASGKRVLDVACGEGYGSSLLAVQAASVVGVDIDAAAVEHARVKYGRLNLSFLNGDCTAIPLPDASIDLAVSFETLEHHAEQEAMMAEFQRVLAPDGILIISTPDRQNYSDKRQYINPYHVRELYGAEFKALIHRYFQHAEFYGQRVVYGSLIVPQQASGPFHSYAGDSLAISSCEGMSDPFYLLALASQAELPTLPSSMFDGTSSWGGEDPKLVYELLQTKRQLEAVYASIYWRLTLPLRMVRKMVRRVLGI